MTTQSTICSVVPDRFESANFAGMQGETAGAFPSLSTSKPHWVLELEDDGTVIYSRPQLSETNSVERRNFFDEFLGFEDLAAFRQQFQSFVSSKKAAASFVCRCSSAEGTMNTKVLMTRAFQTGYCHPTGVVMMEIRGC